MDSYIQALVTGYLSELKALADFNFNIFTPMFWVVILSSIFVLKRYLSTRKTLEFSFAAATTLLLSAKLQVYIVSVLGPEGEPFFPALNRLISFFVISVIFLAYKTLG